MKAVILAAGRGTRLHPYSDVLPKALMPIGVSAAGALETIIEKLVRQIRRAEVEEIVVVVNYRAEQIMQALGSGGRLGVRLSYVFQEELDGNAGALFRAEHLVAGSDVIVTDCDNDIADDALFEKLVAAHVRARSACTVAVSEVSDVTKFAIIKTDSQGRAVDIFEKPQDADEWGTLAKSGMMIFAADLVARGREISRTPSGEFTTTEMIAYCLRNSLPVALHTIDEGFHDIGTWAEYIPILRQHLG